MSNKIILPRRPPGQWHKRFSEARDEKDARKQGLLLGKIFDDICDYYKNEFNKMAIDLILTKLEAIEEIIENKKET